MLFGLTDLLVERTLTRAFTQTTLHCVAHQARRCLGLLIFALEDESRRLHLIVVVTIWTFHRSVVYIQIRDGEDLVVRIYCLVDLVKVLVADLIQLVLLLGHTLLIGGRWIRPQFPTTCAVLVLTTAI